MHIHPTAFPTNPLVPALNRLKKVGLQTGEVLAAMPFHGGGKTWKSLLLLLLLVTPLAVLAQAPLKQWDQTFGGSDYETFSTMIPTAGGGYLLGGPSRSGIGGEKSEESRGEEDFWIVKLDSKAEKQWDKTYGGSDRDWLTTLIATADGGYLLGGFSASGNTGDKTQNNRGSHDYWVVKLDSTGNKQWDKTFGGSEDDQLQALLGGFSASGISGDKTAPNLGTYQSLDYWLVKINSQGQKQWDKTFGGSSWDALYGMIATLDGGYLLSGQSISGISGNKSEGNRGSFDLWLVKLDANANQQWDKTFGGSEWEGPTSPLTTPDGGYVLFGTSASGISGEKSEASRGKEDYWVLKIDASGKKLWDKTYGGSDLDGKGAIVPTRDGGYLLGGSSFSYATGDKTESGPGAPDYWVVKIDGNGAKQWDKTIGGHSTEFLGAMLPTPDGGHLLGGYSYSSDGGDKTTPNRGGSDYWLVKLAPEKAAPAHFSLNAGGGVYMTKTGRIFNADSYYRGGRLSTHAAGEVANTEEDSLYRQGRVGESFSYHLPTTNGRFRVRLHFCETWWGNLKPGGVGSRQFNVDIEGERKLTDYDIYQKAGGAMKAIQESFTVEVTDGELTLAFSKGSKDYPYVVALEVMPAIDSFRVNAGGETYTTKAGQVFSADSYYSGGRRSTLASGNVAGTEDDLLYQQGRVGESFSYQFLVEPATYQVTLHFNETWWGNLVQEGGVGSRKFNVDIEGERKLTEYDIFRKAGGAMRAVQETFTVPVTDGELNLLFSRGSKDYPYVAAFEVEKVEPSSAARSESKTSKQERWLEKLYPNPVQEALLVELLIPASQIKATQIMDTRGTVYFQDSHQLVTERSLRLPVGSLPKGLYLLKLQTQGEMQVIKFVKQ
jgi:hypothetical protein